VNTRIVAAFANSQISASATSASNDKAAVDALSVRVGDVPFASLEGIWKKATELVNSSTSIAPAPGHPQGAKMVASQSGSRPNLVRKGKGGLYHCDRECVNFQTLKMCSHVVAVAHVNEDLLLH